VVCAWGFALKVVGPRCATGIRCLFPAIRSRFLGAPVVPEPLGSSGLVTAALSLNPQRYPMDSDTRLSARALASRVTV